MKVELACNARAWCEDLLNQCWISEVPESDRPVRMSAAGFVPVAGKPKGRRRAPT